MECDTLPVSMPRGLSANLDFLRSVAVLLVLGQHLTRRLWPHAIPVPTGYLGLFGVLLFFVHTSLVLMYSMERSGLEGRALFRDFYIRRAFRIYPLSIVAVGTALVLHLNSNVNGIAGLSYGPRPSVKAALVQFLLIQNLLHVKSIVNVLWSLPFEVQMYFFLPLFFLWVRGRRMFGPLLALWILALFGAWVQPRIWLLAPGSLLLYVPCFLAGIIAYTIPHNPRIRSFVWPLFILGLVMAYTIRPGEGIGRFLCLILGLGIPFFHEIQNRPVRFVSNRIATYSFGIYLAHQFCIWFVLEVLAARSALLRGGALLSLLILIPMALYHGFEKPMINLGVRLAVSARETVAKPHVSVSESIKLDIGSTQLAATSALPEAQKSV